MRQCIKILLFTILVLASNTILAETISTTTTIDATKIYSGDVTVRNCRYEINAAVTVNGDFTAEGATIVIGENGSLHVTGNFSCTSYEVYGGLFGMTLKSTTGSTTTIAGDLIVDGNINVNGYNSNSICSLTVSGNAEIRSKNLTVGSNGDLTISGKASVAQTTTINGSTTVNSNGEIDTNNLAVGSNGDLTMSGKASVAQTTTINGSTTVNSNGEIDTNNLTVGSNGDLTMSGKASVAQTTTINGSTTVNSNGEIDTNNLTVGRYGDLTLSGRTIVDENATINGSATVNSNAILYTKNDMTIGEYGEISLNPGSITIIEGDLYQDGDTPVSLGIAFPHQGDIKAQNATLVVAGNYTIWEGWASGADQNSDFPDPTQNEDFFVFGSNNLDIIDKIESSPGNRDAFYEKHPNGLAGFIIDILPIELVYFTAEEFGGGVRFAWETASELNNDYFTIEYSINAVDFTELTTIEGAGTSTELKYYRYTDFSSNCGIVYYRLKQTDYDGKYSYSKIVSVTFAEKQITDSYNYFIYPNPATDHISIGGGSYESVSFVSANGSVLRRESASGSHDITRLPKGINFVIIHTADGNVSKTFIKQ